jgi:acyl-CoA synthetase (AMP-forming)/AMP-acid ligase II
MNCAVRLLNSAREFPKRTALWSEKHHGVTFREMLDLAANAQRLFRRCEVKPGVPVVIAASPGPEMFAAVCGLLGLGAPILLIEPWMPVERIDHVIQMMKPGVFFSGFLGKLWGLRIPAVRKIPHWVTPADIRKESGSEYIVEDLACSSQAVIAFSSGTTGLPKGVVRTQGFMWELHEIFVGLDAPDRWTTPDLAVFPNIALYHLGTGRGAVLVPSRWTRRSLARIAQLPRDLRPETVTCGPAFLKTLLSVPGFESLKDFHVGGALTDCWILENSFARWPEARFAHVYGGSEAEPVALQDARLAVQLSRERGLFQTLSIGRPVPIIRWNIQPDSLWVSGPNVASEYVHDASQNLSTKKRDAEGRLWHCMGDRIREDHDGWWYCGRTFQPLADFELEQRIYSFIKHSGAFLFRDHDDSLHLFGETVEARKEELRKMFPELTGVHSTKIVRDRRHRARIDRTASLPKAFRQK